MFSHKSNAVLQVTAGGWVERLSAPGERLMQRFRIRTKLALIAVSVVAPLILFLGMTQNTLWAERQVALDELDGVEVAERLVPLSTITQQLRGLTHHQLSSAGRAVLPLAKSRTELKAAVADMDALLAKGLRHELQDLWQPLRQRLLDVAEGRHPPAKAAAWALHTQLIDDLTQLVLLNAERSTLLLDPVATSYHLMDLATSHLPRLQGVLSQTRGFGTGVLAEGHADELTTLPVHAKAAIVEHAIAEAKVRIGALQRAGGTQPGSAELAFELAQAFATETKTTFSAIPATAEPSAYFANGTVAVTHIEVLHRDLLVRLKSGLRVRAQNSATMMALSTAAAAAGLLILGYLLVSFNRSFLRSLDTLREGTQAIASGNLAHSVNMPGNDELAEIGHVIDAMSNRLSSMVSDIRNSASLVNITGQQVSDGSARLATRTDEQASSLRSSVDAINGLAASVAQNAGAAHDLDALTGRLAKEAEEGHTAMRETVQAMEQMRLASDRVAEVVAVIDDVAFQTSMLSLNAAIEASRAGESGKGFAVVASEVRQLAQRCAEAADEIRQLIGNAGTQVQISSEKLSFASTSLDALVSGVRHVSASLKEISDTSAQQSESLQNVTQTVGNLDEITRENAALVEESSTASHALVGRAGLLREAVATMRLRQGSADEAMLMVQQARAHIEEVGREQAFAAFHDPAARFIDRDLYIFAFDREGMYTACGSKPANVGKDYSVTPGLDKEFLTRIWAAADAGGGWVRYEVINPLTNAVMPKESYVTALDDRTLIGCGVYREATAEAKGPRKAAAWSRRQESALV